MVVEEVMNAVRFHAEKYKELTVDSFRNEYNIVNLNKRRREERLEF
jgi:hypothetical protein